MQQIQLRLQCYFTDVETLEEAEIKLRDLKTRSFNADAELQDINAQIEGKNKSTY